MRGVFIGYGRDLAQAVEERRLGGHIAEELKARLLDMALSGLFHFNQGRRGGGGFWGAAAGFAGSLFGGGRPAAGPCAGAITTTSSRTDGPSRRCSVAMARCSATPTRSTCCGPGRGRRCERRRTGAGVTVDATYAPHNTVEGSVPEIDAMRRELAEASAPASSRWSGRPSVTASSWAISDGSHLSPDHADRGGSSQAWMISLVDLRNADNEGRIGGVWGGFPLAG